MSNRAKFLVGMLGVLILIGAAAFLFLRFQVRKSFPDYSGSLKLVGLVESVTVSRDEFGVPRIEAANEHDLMFAWGYVHAQDRLWQMDVARRVGEGRLSELFGEVTVPFDRMFRIIGIRRVSEEIEHAIAEESRNRLVWYAEGVNAFIGSHRGRYPVEFDLLGYEPETWTPVHSIIIGRLMAWELNLSWWSDLTLGAIVTRVGREKAQNIFPSYPANIPPIVESTEWRQFAELGSGLQETTRKFRDFMGFPAMMGGSNAWVVGPAKSISKNVILANDTHLRLQNPSKWFEVQAVAPGYFVSGMSVPGVPGVVAGRNAHIAWGMTNVMADDADFYIERIDSSDTTRYWYDSRWHSITYSTEEIRVKDDSAETVTIRSTHHGPIVTDIRTPLKHTHYPFVASMRWTGFEISDQLDAFNKINRAKDWKEFRAGVRAFTGPGQNFIYGDTQGNIGYYCGVLLPIRGVQNGMLPLPGWEKEAEWKGFVPFEKLPHSYNPPDGFIATANNKIVDDSYPYRISELWEPPSRVQRLREVLGKNELFSVTDFELLQNDKFSIYAKELTPFILEACADSALDIPEESLVLEYLRNWNFFFETEDIATSIFQQFFVRLVSNTLQDELGEELLHDYVLLANIPIRVIMRLVQMESSDWFDDVRTDHSETKNEIIRRSMREAIALLKGRFGGDLKNWQWGEMHMVALQHPFGLRKPLDKIFNIGPFPYGGGPTALVSGEYSQNDPFAVTVGASFRHIVDMARPYEARVVIPSGQSGQVFHKHYSDQTQLWLNGGYRTSHMDSAYVSRASWDRLRLEPGR
ncbi:MAG: penicillin acylase family protein [Ignavibacteriae bacterium]|nr:penicillin acylase family protein [Ignavibacteriota bacterium]